jgi:predicted alpha-1,6-mannanase (GH76 family)
MLNPRRVLLLSATAFIAVQNASFSHASPVVQRDLQPRAQTYLTWAQNAIDVLNDDWYSTSTGQWNGQWWQSACAMAMIADMGAVDPSWKPNSVNFFSNSLTKAANGGGSTNFIGQYYDDMGWWAVAWIRAYDITGDSKYFSAAQTIYTNMLTGLGTPCGGIYWSKARANLATISNVL